MQLDGITPGGGHEHRRDLKGIKAVNDGAMDISDRFSSDRGHSACGIYSKPHFSSRDRSPDDHHLDPPKPDYGGSPDDHHLDQSGLDHGNTGSTVENGPDDHHLDPPKPDYGSPYDDHHLG